MEPDNLSPLLQQQLSQLSSGFGTFWHRVRSKLVTSIINSLGITGIVDIGAGSGTLGKYLRSYCPHVQYRFQEPIKELADALEAEIGFGANVPYTEKYRDNESLVLLDVIEHIQEPSKFFEELTRKLTPGNFMIVTVPAGNYLFSAWDVNLGHYRRYSRSGLLEFASDKGLLIIECTYIFPELLIPAIFRRMRSKSTSQSTRAEFPNLPKFIDIGLEIIGNTTSRLRRYSPLGTSLLMVLQKPMFEPQSHE